MTNKRVTNDLTVEEWIDIRKKEALKINPNTAEVSWTYIQTLDPYGIDNLPEELQQLERGYFARNPGGHVWVSFYDLTRDTVEKLMKKHRRKLHSPEGLEPGP